MNSSPCHDDGTALKVMGKEASEELHVVPARIEVIFHVRRKYACPMCEEGVKIAPAPATLLVCCDRQIPGRATTLSAEPDLCRHGAEIPRNHA